MRIHEILFWNNEPADRSDPHLDVPPGSFSRDPTNLANAFTRRGLVKHFWNLPESEGSPSGPAPPDIGTELIPNGTLGPTTASWLDKPGETDSPVGRHELVPFRQWRSRSASDPTTEGYHSGGRGRCERRHEVSGRPFETIGCPSCSSASMLM